MTVRGAGRGAAAGLLLAAALGACLRERDRREDVVRVFAAASLAGAFGELARALERARPGTRVELNTAGSQVLRAQIEQGAPADVYAFADLAEAQALRRAGLVQPHRVFARNRLCVVTPADEPRVRSLADLAAPGVRVVVAGSQVPAGRYTEQALSNLERVVSRPGAGFALGVQRNVVSRENSVRAVLAKVAFGEADAGFVYASDARAARVRRIDIPAEANVVATYPIGLVRRAPSEAALAFVEAVMAPPGRDVLARHGFELP